MTLADLFLHLSALDLAALVALYAAWLGTGWVIDREDAARPSVSVLMNGYRREWMRQMVTREPRIFDAQIITKLRQGTAFFGSATMLALGAGLAVLGNVEMIAGIARDLALTEAPRAIWQAKLCAGLVILMHAFLRFVWSNRLFGYAAVMMAAVPNDPADAAVPGRVHKSAELAISASRAFNEGLRSIYFSLAAVAWLVGAVPLMLATAITLWVIWRREYGSRSRAVLIAPDS